MEIWFEFPRINSVCYHIYHCLLFTLLVTLDLVSNSSTAWGCARVTAHEAVLVFSAVWLWRGKSRIFRVWRWTFDCKLRSAVFKRFQDYVYTYSSEYGRRNMYCCSKKQESWFRLDFLFENGCVVQLNDSRSCYFPENLRLPFLLLGLFLLCTGII